MYRTHRNFIRSIFCLLVAGATVLAAAPAGALPDTCDAAPTLSPTGDERRAESALGEAHCYRLELPAPGIFHAYVSVSGGEAARARLRLFGSPGREAPPEETLERSVGERLILAAAGTWWIEVAAEDPRLPLPAYRLSSRFVELEGRPGAPVTKEGEDDGELEPDPETLVAPVLPTKDGEDDGELEPDPETFRVDGSDGSLRAALCRDGDDHGDSFACATAFYGDAEGDLGSELGGGWDDDADLFRFRLLEWRTLVITGVGDAGTYGELYDRTGQRLAADGGEGGGFRLVRTLGPGEYFVRVGGRDAGTYRLSARDAER